MHLFVWISFVFIMACIVDEEFHPHQFEDAHFTMWRCQIRYVYPIVLNSYYYQIYNLEYVG